jgi:hypothetical protein
VERTSRLRILVPLTGRDSLTVGGDVTVATGGLPAAIRRSLTRGCGIEKARHANITATGRPVYFAHPHSPWERGSNENLNRLVREYFPEGVKIASVPITWRWWLPKSTADPVKFIVGRNPPSYSLNLSRQILPPTESATICGSSTSGLVLRKAQWLICFQHRTSAAAVWSSTVRRR